MKEGRITHRSSGATAGNANADITVPAEGMEVLFGQVILVADGTVASRQLAFQILDSDANLIFDTHAGVVVTAGLTVHFELMRGIFRETAIVAGSIQVPIPMDCALKGGWIVRTKLSSGGQAGDSFTVILVTSETPNRY